MAAGRLVVLALLLIAPQIAQSQNPQDQGIGGTGVAAEGQDGDRGIGGTGVIGTIRSFGRALNSAPVRCGVVPLPGEAKASFWSLA